jgi:hypothetical protein
LVLTGGPILCYRVLESAVGQPQEVHGRCHFAVAEIIRSELP